MTFAERLRINRVAFQTIVTKEVIRFFRIWPQTLLPSAITTTLYFVIFGSLIGSRVGEMGGRPYMEFLVPGLIMMAVINNAYLNVSSSFFSAKFQKHIEELLVSPASNAVILWGFVLAGVLRGVTVGLIVTLISLGFCRIQVASIAVTASVLFLTATLFALGGFLNAMLAKKFDDISFFPTFILTPLTYLGGIFYTIDLLPPFWRSVSRANPIVYMISAFRYGILGVVEIPPFVAYLIMSLSVVILWWLASLLLKRGVGLRG